MGRRSLNHVPLRLIQEIWRIDTALSSDRGFGAEDHVEKAFAEAMKGRYRSGSIGKRELPSWLLSIRRATSQEDHLDKVDFVIITSDVGELYLQVKSSRKGADKFMKRQHRKDIAVVVIKRTDTFPSVRSKVIMVLEEKREHYKHERNRSQRRGEFLRDSMSM